MYNYILILKGHNKHLATLEFETLWKTYFDEKIKLEKVQNVLYKFNSNNLIKEKNEILKRLTYTNYLGIILEDDKNLEYLYKKIKIINFKEYENKSFCIRIKKAKRNQKVTIEEKELAKILWDKFQNPTVNLKNPDIEFNYVFLENKKNIFFCRKIFENKKDYLRRMPKLRPIAMPYTLKSDMARASINLLELKKGIILDPFCGIGGILLEAKDMNFKIIGNDINWNDLKYFKINFKYFFPNSKYTRILADSKNQFLKENSIDGIVCDIPYGKCSRLKGTDLYENFLESAKKYLKKGKKIVIIYANFVDFKNLALKYFKEESQIDEYINRSMTRHILVLKNSK